MLKKALVTLMSLGVGVVLSATLTCAADSNVKSNTPSPAEFVRARMGLEIQTKTERRPAKTPEQVQSVDKFRIYTLPETQPEYVYVLFADQESVEQLNPPEHVLLPPAALLLLPGCQEWYTFETTGPLVTLTLISSATPLLELETVLKTPKNLSQWRDLEKNLLAQSHIDLSTAVLKPYVLAGSTRDCNSAESDAFLATLKISSGKGLVLKKYEFRVQK